MFHERAEIIRVERLAGNIFRFTAISPLIAAAAHPGQFVMIKTAVSHDPLLRRPFSIHRAAIDGRLQVLFKALGKGTKLLAALDCGNILDLLGPFGRGFDVAGDNPICLVGGGLGVAPLFFLVKKIVENKLDNNLVVLLGSGNRAEMATVIADIRKMGVDVKQATDDGSAGYHGLVTDLMKNLARDRSWRVYACGPYAMMRAAAAICRRQSWDCQVSLETAMACGMGACLGCALPSADNSRYLHACKDGPVMNASEIWP